MKNIYLLILITSILILSCKDKRIKNETSNFYQKLLDNNITYFIKENPDNYHNMFWYSELLTLDSIVKSDINLNKKNSEKKEKIIQHIKKMMSLDLFLTNNIDFIELLKSSESYEQLLILEYVASNEVIKDYNYFLYRMPLGKVVCKKNKKQSVGDSLIYNLYFSLSYPKIPFYIIYNNDTTYNINEIKIAKEQINKNQEINGNFYIYSPSSKEYISFPFKILLE